MSRLDTTAEIIKLAQVLSVEQDALSYLEDFDAIALRKMREALVREMFAQNRTMFQRLSASSRLLPNRLVAWLGENVFGSMLAARISGEMSADRAVDVASHMAVPFLSDIARELDPKAAQHIIQAMPLKVVLPVAHEMLKRKDYVTMGRFVDDLRLEILDEVVRDLNDDEALLHVAFFLESKARLSEILRMLPDDRLRNIIGAAQANPDQIWPEALALMSHVDDSLKGRLGNLAADQDDEVLGSLAQVAHTHDLWADVLPVVARMSASAQAKLMSLPALHDVALLTGIIKTAEAESLWADFEVAIAHVDAGQREQFEAIAGQLDDDVRAAVEAAFAAADANQAAS